MEFDGSDDFDQLVLGTDGNVTMSGALTVAGAITGGSFVVPTGRTATLTVAANDASATVKNQADYVCDGTADNVQIQAALDALPDGGGEVALSEGTFNISAPIEVYKASVSFRNTVLRGRGFGATRIFLSDNSNCNMIEFVGGAQDIGFLYLMDMTLNGNRDNQTSGHGYFSENPAGGGNTYDTRIRNIFFLYCKGSGFYITGGWGVMIDNCITEHHGGAGGVLSGSECFINELHSAANDNNGLQLMGSQLQVSNCRIDNNGQAGLKLQNLANSEITNCFIANWGKISASMHGISMINVDKITMSNLVIKGDGTTKTRRGINCDSGSSDNVISGCIIEDVYTNSIHVDGNNNVITGCHVEKGTDGSRAIQQDGTGNVVEHNYGSDEIATGAYTLQPFGVTTIDSSGGAVTGTLGDGSYIGQIKTIVMTDATNSSTVSVTNHETSDPEVGTFDAVDETWVLLWSGTEWITLQSTCT